MAVLGRPEWGRQEQPPQGGGRGHRFLGRGPARDVGHQQEVLELVDWLRLSGKLTVLSALHDLTAAAQFAHRLLLMDGGRIVAAGPPIEVLTEDNIRRHFGANVEVWQSPAGPVVVPRRQVSTSP